MLNRKPRDAGTCPFVVEEKTFMLCSTPVTPSVDCAQAVIRINAGDRPTWPERTDRHCFHCCAGFDGPPAAVPTRWDTKRGAFVVYGAFCSWSCAKRFLLENPHRLACTAQMSAVWLAQLARALGHAGPIHAAPPRAALRAYGGTMSLPEFRAHGTCWRPRVEHLQTPYLPHAEGVRGPFVPGQVRDIRRSKAADAPECDAPERARTTVGFYRTFLAERTPDVEEAAPAVPAPEVPEMPVPEAAPPAPPEEPAPAPPAPPAPGCSARSRRGR